MKLGQLKKSLARMSPDLDECEVLMNFTNKDGKEEYDNLAFSAYTELPKVGIVIVLGSSTAAIKRMKDGTMHYPDGSKPTDESFDVNG